MDEAPWLRSPSSLPCGLTVEGWRPPLVRRRGTIGRPDRHSAAWICRPCQRKINVRRFHRADAHRAWELGEFEELGELESGLKPSKQVYLGGSAQNAME